MKLEAKSVRPGRPKSGGLIVVLGTHRSGTSLAVQVLKLLGVRLGDKLIPGRGDNPAGFWEHSDILQQTKAIERRLGLSPFDDAALGAPPKAWWQSEAIAAERAALTSIVRREVEAGAGPFGFKDPRSLELLPLWQEICAELDVRPRYVLALRHPSEVAASLARRGLSRARAELAWACQLARGAACLADPPAAVAHYEDWFADPTAQAAKLAGALGFSAEHIDEDRLRAVVRADLRHQHSADAEAPIKPVADLYDRICGFDRGRVTWDEVRGHARIIVDTASLFGPIVQELHEEPARLKAKLEQETAKVRRLRARGNEIRMKAGESAAAKLVDQVAPRHPDPSRVEFPGLRSIKPSPNATPRPLKVCIATEDIVGPIRNGGIGTTYTHLAFLLSEAGHEVTILYLRGTHCENGPIDDWVRWYAESGVRFVPVPLPERTRSPAPRWLRPMYALYQHLKGEHYDLVHVSEWRGSAYMCLAAKRQGLEFKNTVFCVKASSPWLWNREYGLHPMDRTADLVKMYAERRSIELADLVVGGSAHLLRWMLDHGYRLPPRRTFVQPNVVRPIRFSSEVNRRRPQPGERVPVWEIVFFGRLEYRKGLDVFCEALHELLSQGVEIPYVTFLGKFGARIPTHPELTARAYVEEQAKAWPFEWQVIEGYQQEQALTYLQEEGRLAVMPSVIENSTLTVYEATHYGFPFIASNVGGTPELVREDHRQVVLTDPHPVSLSAKIKDALDQGGFVAAPSFDNSGNLALWLNFHANVSTIVDSGGWPPSDLRERDTDENEAHQTGATLPLGTRLPKISACLVLNNDPHRLGPTVDALMRCEGLSLEVVLVNDGSTDPEACRWIEDQRRKFKQARPDWKIFERPHFGLPAARNFAASRASGDYLLFLDPNAHPKPDGLANFATAATAGRSDLLTCFSERLTAAQYIAGGQGEFERCLSIVGDPGFNFYGSDWRSPAIIISKRTFEEIQGLTCDYKIPGAVEELIARAILANKVVDTVPEALVYEVTDYKAAERYNDKALLMRTIRPYVRAAPLCYQAILMTARTAEWRWSVLRQNNERQREKNEELRKRASRAWAQAERAWRCNQELRTELAAARRRDFVYRASNGFRKIRRFFGR